MTIEERKKWLATSVGDEYTIGDICDIDLKTVHDDVNEHKLNRDEFNAEWERLAYMLWQCPRDKRASVLGMLQYMQYEKCWYMAYVWDDEE